MPSLPTLPRRTGLERFALAWAVTLTAAGVAMVGFRLGQPAFLDAHPRLVPSEFNAAVGCLFLAIAFLAIEFGARRVAWLTVLPAGLGLATLYQEISAHDLGIDQLVVLDRYFIPGVGATPGRMSPVMAGCLVLVSIVLAWREIRPSRVQVLASSIIGALVFTAGLAAIVGYLSPLQQMYAMGGSTETLPFDAIVLLFLGPALVQLAWRDDLPRAGGPPSWAPLPAVVACLAFTCALWSGLRDRAIANIASDTDTVVGQLAFAVQSEIENQPAAVERFATKWSQNPDDFQPDDADYSDLRRAPGFLALARLGPADLRNRWVVPRLGNELARNLDHSTQPVRREAIERARLSGAPVLSESLDLPGRNRGFAVYVPVRNEGTVTGYFAADYAFRPIVARVASQWAGDYQIAVSADGAPVYDTEPAGLQRSNVYLLEIEARITAGGYQMRFAVAPREFVVQSTRGHLPELGLFAGFGITLLVGLSVHLARTTRVGLVAAERSNRQLVEENEERRRIEAQLKVSDERLRLALDSTQIGIFEWNVLGGRVYYSPGLWAMLGYEASQMPSTVEAWQSLIHPDDLPAYRQGLEVQLTGVSEFLDPEYRVRSRSGEWRWVYMRSRSVAVTSSGSPTRILGTVQDITDRRRSEEALRESQAAARKLSLVAARTDNLVMIVGIDGRIEWVNASFIRVMEYGLDEVVGRNPLDFMCGPETSVRTLRRIRSAVARGRGFSTDIVNYSKSGRQFHLQLEIQPVRNQRGELENFIAMLADITVRVDTERALRRAKAEADEASRSKSEFLASMSHEIRTPMNGVIGMTSLLLETNLNTEQREFVNTIRTSGEALLTIINDILDFSKVESGKMELEHLPFEVAVCLEETLDLFAVSASAKKLELAYAVAPDVPSWIVGDAARLRQVLVNLVNNAVKFTPAGSIAIEVHRLPATRPGAGRATLEFTVRDTGIGIPPERADRLFKAFSQVDSSTTRKYGGTGLGLAICRRLCLLMGGDIRVESTPGRGASFIFSIETAAAAIPVEASLPPLPVALQTAPVVVVEDHPVIQQRLRQFFTAWGAICHVTPTTASVAGLVARLPAPPALLLVDYGDGPVNDPLPSLARIPGRRLVMLPFGQTPPEPPTDGFAYAFLPRPIKNLALFEAVTALFEPRSPAAPADVPPGPRILAEEIPLQILLAEDNVVNQRVALRFLERLGYHADPVANGAEALAAVQRLRYDLVLMDLQMPEMDGLEASREIRSRLPAAHQPKIIALTANALQGDRETCLAAGMDDYITKPVKLHEIEQAIRRQFAPQRKNLYIG